MKGKYDPKQVTNYFPMRISGEDFGNILFKISF